MTRFAAGALALALVVSPSLGSATASAAPSLPSTGSGEAGTGSAKDLDAAISKLGDANPLVRRAAAQSIINTPADALPLLEARLLRPQEAGPGPMWLVLDKARKSLSPQGAAAAGNGGAEVEGDLLDAVMLAGTTPAHRSLALLLAGIRACERQASVAGARVLVRMAGDNKGLLKTTVTAALKRMGDHAVAALIEVRKDPDKDLRGWANKTLDALGKFLPSDAVQVHDPQALADVLVAFGKTKDPDSIRVVISYLNADRAPVRDAARWAIAQFGNDAKAQLKEAHDNFTGEHAGDDWPAERTLKALLAAYDKVRLAEVFKLLDEGTAHRDAGRLEEAITAYDALLARAPTFERRAELAPAYVDLARKRELSDRPAARALLAKAGRLAAGTPLASTIEAEVAYLDTLDLLDRGIVDTSLLHKAVQLDPANVRARDLLQKLENDAQARDSRLRRYAAASAVGILATVAAIMLVGRKKQAPPVRRRPVRI